MAVPVVAGFEVDDVGSAVSSVTVNVPAGAAVGDLLVAWYSIGRPIGDTTLHASFTDSGLGNISHSSHSRLAYRKVQSGDPSSYTFQFASTGAPVAGLILITGADADAPFDGTPSLTLSSTNSAAPTCPSHTTTGADRLILLLDGVQSSNAVVLATEDAGYPSGSTGIWHRNNTASGNRAVNGAAYKTQASAGATGTNAFTIDSARQWVAITAAVKPAAGVAESSGSGSPSIDAATGAGTAGSEAAGSGAGAADVAPVADGAAGVEAASAGAGTTGLPTAAGTASALPGASGAATAALLQEGSGSAAAEAGASGTPSVPGPTGAGSAKAVASASGNPSIAAIVASGLADVSTPGEATGSGAGIGPAVLGDGGVMVLVRPSGSPLISGVASAGEAGVEVNGSGAAVADIHDISGTASVVVNCAGAGEIQAISGVGTAGEAVTPPPPPFDPSTQQGLRQKSWRAIHGQPGDRAYNEDAMLAMEIELFLHGRPVPLTFNERLIAWLQLRLGTTWDNLPDLLMQWAEAEGASTPGAIGEFAPTPGP